MVGLFLLSIDYVNVVIYYLGIEGPIYFPTPAREEELMTANKQKFESACLKNNISFRIHDKIEGSILLNIRHETRYADLLIVSSELFYNNLGQRIHRQYLHNTMHNAECPVLLLPEKINGPRSVILAYDGSESAVFAMKQFAYLFPDFTAWETILVYASEHASDLPASDYIREFAAGHYPSLNLTKLNISKEYFHTWIQSAGPAILAAGASGRSLMSELLKKAS